MSSSGPDEGWQRPYRPSREDSFSSTATTSSRLSLTGGPNSRRKMFAGKALDLSSKVLARSAEYLSSKEWDGAAASLTRADDKVRSVKEARDWGEWDSMAGNRSMQVGGRRTPVPGQQHHASTATAAGATTPDEGQRDEKGKSKAQAGGHSYLSYFGKHQREQRNRLTFTEEHVVCFPGYAALRSPSHKQAGDIDIFLSGYAYRTRPAQAALTRSQRLLIGFARKWTGLPPLPRTTPLGLDQVGNEEGEEEGEEMTAEEEKDLIDLAGGQDEAGAGSGGGGGGDAKERTFATLVEMAEHEADEDLSAPPSRRDSGSFITAEPQELAPCPSSPDQTPKPARSSPAVFPDRDRTPPRPPKPAQVSLAASSTRSAGSRTSSRANSPSPSSTSMRRRNSFEGLDLSQLHHNLRERLQGFFGQKMEGRRVVVEVFVDDQDPSNHQKRPLLTRVVTTRAGGAWGEKMTLPWQTLEAYLKVREGRMDRSPESGVERLRVRVELLKEDRPVANAFNAAAVAVGSTGEQEGGTGEEAMARRIVERVIPVTPAGDQGAFHLVSDIDDTIKRTEVLGGMRSIFRNVFLWSYDEVVVPGMAEWYRSMHDRGVVIHYVSNSPWELWSPIERYLSIAGFPSGSVSLKEYGSILTNMFEAAGSRKKGRIGSLMKEFPSARFLFVGDSGEADLEVYASLAREHPGRVKGVFIRDVTTLPNEKRPATVGKVGGGTGTGSARSSMSSTTAGGSDVGAAQSKPPNAPMAGAGGMPGALPKKPPPALPPRTGKLQSASEPSVATKHFTPPPPAPTNSSSSSTTSAKSTPAGGGGGGGGGGEAGSLKRPTSSSSLSALRDPTTDALSPNNPTVSTPLGYEEDLKRKALLEGFWARVARAEAEVGDGVEVKLFRSGGECVGDAQRMVDG